LRLQKFLNKYEGANLEEDGKYGPETIREVNKYQRKYRRDILYP
jgi:peptidoglycan hydrolase-like protein with peptidoglycan-binding domain